MPPPTRGGSPQGVPRRDRRRGPARGADLDARAHLRAHAAVEAGGPPAVLDLALVEGVLPVLPEPVAVETGVEVVPRQHLGVLAFPGGQPGDVDARARQRLVGAAHPALVREVLAPAVETATVAPH